MHIALIWFIISISYKLQQWFDNDNINLDIARKLVKISSKQNSSNVDLLKG